MIAHCDLSTGKIYGCKKGSFQWYHEEGHFKFNNKFSFLLLIRGYAFQLCLFLTVWGLYFTPFWFPAVLIWIIYAGLGFFEELWCNSYSIKKIKTFKKYK